MKFSAIHSHSIKGMILWFFDKKTTSGSIMRNMTILATGNVLGNLIGMAAAPVITRLYSPDDFGILSIFSVILGFLTPFVTLRYSAAIPLPQKSSSALNIFVLCLFITFINALFLSVLLVSMGGYFFNLISAPHLLNYWFLFPIGVIGIGLFETLSMWATREKLFKTLSKTKVSRSLSGAVVKIGLGLLSVKPLGLLIGNLVSQFAGNFSILLQSKKTFITELKLVSRAEINTLAKRFFDFPRYQIPSRFLLVFIQQAPIMAMASIYGTSEAGQLGLAITVISLPVNLLISTTSQSFFADIAKIGKKNPSKIYELTKSISFKMFVIGIFPCLFLFLFAPILFKLVFGFQWIQAGQFARVLSILLMARFITSPIINTMTVLEKQHIIFKMNVVTAFLTIAVLGLGYYLDVGAVHLLYLHVFAITFQTSLYFYVVLKTIKNYGVKENLQK